MNNLAETINSLFRSNNLYVSHDGSLLKAKIYHDALNANPDVVRILLSSDETKEVFFQNVDGVLVFDKLKFAWMIESNEFLPNSFTKFSNKIGITNNNEFISKSNEVVLSFPFKDCILEGGQDSEDRKKDEVFYNEIIANNQINRMLSPKALGNAKRYSTKGIEENITFNENDNLVIKGNNLLAISTLLKRFQGKVKFIYIDPPYNTGNDSFNYNDKFNHSSWLVFMKNRLEIARDLLSDDGIIFVQCDDNEQAYLKVLMDEIFGRDCFYGQLIQLKGNTQNDSKTLQRNHEYILCYSKTVQSLLVTYGNKVKKKVYEEHYYLGRDTGASSGDDTLAARENLGYTIYYYEGTENGSTGNSNTLAARENLGYTDFNVLRKHGKVFHAIAIHDYDTSNLKPDSTEEEIYTTNESLISLGYVPIRPPKRGLEQKLGRWTWGIETFKDLWNKDQVLIKNNKNVIKKEFVEPEDITIEGGEMFYIKENKLPMQSIINITNSKGTVELKKLFGANVFSNPKNEELLALLIENSTKENDLILDFFLGSGTTCAVAHKMNRRYIGIEQMDYINDVTVRRLEKVIEGEQTGISKEVNWDGGGSFVYCELLDYSNKLVEEILSSSPENIEDIKNKVYNSETLVPFITKQELEQLDQEFDQLNFDQKQKILISLIDKNKLYINLSDINDSELAVSDADKLFSNSFYKVS